MLSPLKKPLCVPEPFRIQAEDRTAQTHRTRFHDKTLFHQPPESRFGLAHAEPHPFLQESPSRYAFQGIRHLRTPHKVAQYLSDHSLVKLKSIRRQWQPQPALKQANGHSFDVRDPDGSQRDSGVVFFSGLPATGSR